MSRKMYVSYVEKIKHRDTYTLHVLTQTGIHIIWQFQCYVADLYVHLLFSPFPVFYPFPYVCLFKLYRLFIKFSMVIFHVNTQGIQLMTVSDNLALKSAFKFLSCLNYIKQIPDVSLKWVAPFLSCQCYWRTCTIYAFLNISIIMCMRVQWEVT